MSSERGAVFSPEVIDVMRIVLSDAWAALPPELQARTSQSALAERILASAADGETDLRRLRLAALGEFLAS
jgi:hypothetical protein